MNLIFLNSLEKRAGDDRVRTAQVSIGEHQGAWRVLWNEPEEDGRMGETVWYEGSQWSGMLQAFRERIREKIRGGYAPMIDGYALKDKPLSDGLRKLKLLHFHAVKACVPDLFEKLRAWRRESANREGKAAFIVASNQILTMIGAYVPHTLEELEQIPRFGANRAKLYAEPILAITREYSRETAFPLDWVEDAVDEQEFRLWLDEQDESRERMLQDKMTLKRKLLEAISAGGTLEAMEKQFSMNRRDIVTSIEQLDKEGYDVDGLVDAELEAVDSGRLEKAARLFRELGDRYLKPVMQRLYTEEELKDNDLSRIYEWMRLCRLKCRKQAVV